MKWHEAMTGRPFGEDITVTVFDESCVKDS